MKAYLSIKSAALLLGIFIGCALFACKQEEAESDYGFSAVVVSDFDRSVDWFIDVLDFELINKNVIPERGLKQANLKFNQMRLEIIALESSISPTSLLPDEGQRVMFQGLFKTGYSIRNFDEKIIQWEGKKIISKDQVVRDPETNKQMVILRDPDGNRIQIFEN